MTIDVARHASVEFSDLTVRRIITQVIVSPAADALRRYGVNSAKKFHVPGTTGLPRRSDAVGTPRDDASISVAFVGSSRMRDLNQTYRGEDRVTDVLAFPFISSFRGAKRRGISHQRKAVIIGKIPRGVYPEQSRRTRDDEGGDLGELVVCPVYVKVQAKRAGEPFKRELSRVLIHGTLHLLGHDHRTPREAEEMFGLQESLVDRCSQ